MRGPCWHKLSSMNKRRKSYKEWKKISAKKQAENTAAVQKQAEKNAVAVQKQAENAAAAQKQAEKNAVAEAKVLALIKGKKARNNYNITKKSHLINLPSNRIKKTQNIRIDISKPYVTNIIYADIDVISKPNNSPSNSVVFKITDKKTGFLYILKVMIDEDNNDISFKTEEENYKTMKNILSKRLTPHIFTFIDSKTFKPGEIDGTFLDTEIKGISGINNIVNFDKVNNYYLLLTETSDYYLMTLDMFLILKERYLSSSNHIIFNILFQIMYTLYIFNKLKIKHNDLHFGNIMVSLALENILKPKFKIKYNNIYHFNGKRVCLPNIGISVRIFDFDRTTKFKTDSYGKRT